MARRILFVEDDLSSGALLTQSLIKTGFEVIYQNSLNGIMQISSSFLPDLFLLDVEVGNESSLDLLPAIRLKYPSVPVIFMSSHTDNPTVERSYLTGVSQYVKKPFSFIELIHQINTLLPDSNSIPIPSDCIPVGQYILHTTDHRLDYLNETVKTLNPKEFQLLRILLENKGEIVSRKDILQQVWGNEEAGVSLNNYIVYLRNELKKDSQIEIQAIRNVGYRLVF